MNKRQTWFLLIKFFLFFFGLKLTLPEDKVFAGASLSLKSKEKINKPTSASNIHIPNDKTRNVLSSKVAIAKGKDIEVLTREALEMLGGLSKIIHKGDRVFIKPNYITGGLDGHDPVGAGEVPHPSLIAAVAEECIKEGASEVIIGEWVERPVVINFGGSEGKEGAQIKHRIDLLNKKYGNKIYLINLMGNTSYFKYVPTETPLRYLAIPNLVAEADVVISIAVLKTHHIPSPVSLGMKNFMGIMPSILYGEPRRKLHEAGVHQVIVDINKALKPKLTLISGFTGLENRGASVFLGGKTVDISQRAGGYLVIAGFDPVATDATATRIISKGWHPLPDDPVLGAPWYVHHIRMAYEQGLGNIRQDLIDIQGSKLEEVMMHWKSSDDGVYPEKPGDKYIPWKNE